MGRRIIISETERKNILSLYESTNVAPPPSESILIAKKNPFKDNNYVNARKFYNPSMKDGDLFFENSNNFRTYLEDELNKKLIGKTVRGILGTIDVIIEIKDLDVFIKRDDNLGTQCIESMVFRGTMGDGAKEERFDYEINPGTVMSFEDYLVNVSMGVREVKLSNPQALKTVIFSVSNWNLIPDEYFEIRKIQRQKTDF